MAKNDYLARQRAAQQTYLDIGEEMGIQKAWDYIQIVLHNPAVMGKNALGKGKIKKVYEELAKVSDHYKTAFSDDKEADYRQEELDGVLREIWGDEFVPFKDRYPYIKEQSYKKGKKDWK
jgi:hypothetical protein